jgi:hypothetical protein
MKNFQSKFKSPSAFYKAFALLITLSIITFLLEAVDALFAMPSWFDYVLALFVISGLLTGFSLCVFAKESDFESCDKERSSAEK